MSSNFHLSIVSHAAAIVLGIVATTAYLTVYPTNPQSLADYISAICAKSFRSASAGEAPYLAENVSAMTKMMVDMGIRPSGDVDTDFVFTRSNYYWKEAKDGYHHFWGSIAQRPLWVKSGHQN